MKTFALSLTCLLALGLAAERPARALDEDDLQTEINDNCSTNGCVIDLCGDTYTFGRTGDVIIDGDVRKTVVLEGCGWDSSIIERDGDSGSTGKSMIFVRDGGSLTLRNLKISYKETCSANCGSSSGSIGLVQLQGRSALTVENVHFFTGFPGTNRTSGIEFLSG